MTKTFEHIYKEKDSVGTKTIQILQRYFASSIAQGERGWARDNKSTILFICIRILLLCLNFHLTNEHFRIFLKALDPDPVPVRISPNPSKFYEFRISDTKNMKNYFKII